jgi:hypothetical protein
LFIVQKVDVIASGGDIPPAAISSLDTSALCGRLLRQAKACLAMTQYSLSNLFQ